VYGFSLSGIECERLSANLVSEGIQLYRIAGANHNLGAVCRDTSAEG
jgi:hypothetical protein